MKTEELFLLNNVFSSVLTGLLLGSSSLGRLLLLGRLLGCSGRGLSSIDDIDRSCSWLHGCALHRGTLRTVTSKVAISFSTVLEVRGSPVSFRGSLRRVVGSTVSRVWSINPQIHMRRCGSIPAVSVRGASMRVITRGHCIVRAHITRRVSRTRARILRGISGLTVETISVVAIVRASEIIVDTLMIGHRSGEGTARCHTSRSVDWIWGD